MIQTNFMNDDEEANLIYFPETESTWSDNEFVMKRFEHSCTHRVSEILNGWILTQSKQPSVLASPLCLWKENQTRLPSSCDKHHWLDMIYKDN